MREIKFRAWYKEEKVMVGINTIYFGAEMASITTYKDTAINSCVLKGEELEFMQFTGLQDCNGVDIYEGDIIELWYEICSGEYREYSDKGMVCFENGLFKIKCIDEQQEYDFDFFHHVDDSTKEVIGNIYENPELLEVTE